MGFSHTNACSAEIILKLQMNNTTDSNIEVSVLVGCGYDNQKAMERAKAFARAERDKSP
jgi:hypothetical protein